MSVALIGTPAPLHISKCEAIPIDDARLCISSLFQIEPTPYTPDKIILITPGSPKNAESSTYAAVALSVLVKKAQPIRALSLEKSAMRATYRMLPLLQFVKNADLDAFIDHVNQFSGDILEAEAILCSVRSEIRKATPHSILLSGANWLSAISYLYTLNKISTFEYSYLCMVASVMKSPIGSDPNLSIRYLDLSDKKLIGCIRNSFDDSLISKDLIDRFITTIEELPVEARGIIVHSFDEKEAITAELAKLDLLIGGPSEKGPISITLSPALMEHFYTTVFGTDALKILPLFGICLRQELWIHNTEQRIIHIPAPFMDIPVVHDIASENPLSPYNHDVLYHLIVDSAIPRSIRQCYSLLAKSCIAYEQKSIAYVFTDRPFPYYHKAQDSGISTQDVFLFSILQSVLFTISSNPEATLSESQTARFNECIDILFHSLKNYPESYQTAQLLSADEKPTFLAPNIDHLWKLFKMEFDVELLPGLTRNPGHSPKEKFIQIATTVLSMLQSGFKENEELDLVDADFLYNDT